MKTEPSMKPARLALVVGLVLAAARDAGAQGVPAEEFVVIPLRVHVLRSPEIDMANGRLTDAEVAVVVGNINAIWHKAGIHFGVESVLSEPVAQAERFRAVAGLKGGEVDPDDLRILLPRASRSFDGLHVYCFHELPFNSVYMVDDAVFVHEAARVRPVPGGGDDPIARVTAHALGNLLTLPNVAEPRNLMGNGTSGIALDGPQAESARKVARLIAGAMTVEGLRKAIKAAEARGDVAAARRLRFWLGELPGAAAAGSGRR
jgi:hypothetical protein